MPVWVGVTANLALEEGVHSLRRYYLEAVRKTGAVPVIVPCLDVELVPFYAERLNALVLSGGGDVDPCHWGEMAQRGLGQIVPERDQFELALSRWAVANDIPLLAICRGMQVLNVALGGSLYQDIRGNRALHYQNAPRDYPIHEVLVNSDTLLFSIVREQVVRVNSFHHQAVKKLGNGLKVGAVSRDGMIEAVELPGKRFILGVQWHPESLAGAVGEEIFRHLVSSATKKSKRRMSSC